MIYGLTPMSAAQKVLSNLTKIEVNTLLQLGIEVLKKQKDGTYLIKLGQHTFTTKSDQPLQPGHEYWVRMRQSRDGIVHLEKLMPKPVMLKMADTLPIDLSFLKILAKESDPGGSFKEHLLHLMAASTSKESFQNLTQLLLSLHHGVLSLPIKEHGRTMLLQMRKGGRNHDLNQKSVEFYAAMHNLGPLKGSIVQTGPRRDLTLSLHYPESVALLKGHIGTLEGFTTVTIKPASAPVKPFWDKERASLLDIKG